MFSFVDPRTDIEEHLRRVSEAERRAALFGGRASPSPTGRRSILGWFTSK